LTACGGCVLDPRHQPDLPQHDRQRKPLELHISGSHLLFSTFNQTASFQLTVSPLAVLIFQSPNDLLNKAIVLSIISVSVGSISFYQIYFIFKTIMDVYSLAK
jgi:uncharacterized protein YpmS